MNPSHRLFDCLDFQLKNGPIEGMLVAKENGHWKKYSTTEVKQLVDQLSAGIISLGISGNDMSIEGRDKIAILSKNCPEWVILDLAVQQSGAILVPIYPTAHPKDIEFILNDAQVKLCFVNDEELFHKVQSIKDNLIDLKAIFSFQIVNDCRHWKEILTMGKMEDFEHLAIHSKNINTEDVFTIIYTSGTTGTPKGVMLTHHNVLSNVMSTLPYFPINRNSRVLSFLPLNHIFERMVTYVYLFGICSIHYAESLDTLGENIREVKPQMFTTVPRLLEKVYERIGAKGNQLKGIKRKLFNWSLSLAEKYDINKKGSALYRAQLSIANKIVFNKWREGLGNSIKCIVTGAAACQLRLIRIFTAAGIPILEGYGQTESSPVISVNRLDERMFGSVGPVIDGVQVKIASDGEILCKGPNVMAGYYKRPDLTEETIKEGWLYTGDIGILINDKFLKITDRKKEIFKTSGGKYVAPQPIENKLSESPYIEQVMVLGADEKFTSALIVPSIKAVTDWCKSNNANSDLSVDKLIVSNEVIHLFQSVIDEMNKNFNHVEQIKKFELLQKEWSVDGGELTPTLKLKRKIIMNKYADIIHKIYNSE